MHTVSINLFWYNATVRLCAVPSAWKLKTPPRQRSSSSAAADAAAAAAVNGDRPYPRLPFRPPPARSTRERRQTVAERRSDRAKDGVLLRFERSRNKESDNRRSERGSVPSHGKCFSSRRLLCFRRRSVEGDRGATSLNPNRRLLE